MKTNLGKIKLTEKDKRTIAKNSNVCTDSHGRGCNQLPLNEDDKNLN